MCIKYSDVVKNGFRFDVKGAVAAFIAGEEGYALTLFPQALNPFIRSLESMGLWGQCVIVPVVKKRGAQQGNDSGNYKPLYMVLKVSEHYDNESLLIDWE